LFNEQDKKTLAQFKTDLLDDVQKQMNEFKKSRETQVEKTKAVEQSHETQPHHNGMNDDTVPTTPLPLS
jgi:hypothetical protein